MNYDLDLSTVLWIYWIVIVCFTVGMLLLRRSIPWESMRFWIGGDIISAAGIVVLQYLIAQSARPGMSVIPLAIVLLAQLLKVLSLINRNRRTRASLIGFGIIAVYLVCAIALDGLVKANLTIGLSSLTGAIFLAWQAHACLKMPRWWRSQGSKVFVAACTLTSIFLVLAGLRGLNVAEDQFVFQQSPNANVNFVGTLVFFIISHICLIAMLVSRLSQAVTVGRARQRQQLQLMKRAEEHASAMAAAAKEKQSLLDVLIHEVRQPLNNAQAALNDVTMTLDEKSRDYRVGQKLQSIIDHVVLSLSNAIVGASIIERKTQSLLVSTNLVPLCKLACSDMGIRWEDRIELQIEDQAVFADADPVLLRLALRNLLDNALKHSPEESKVNVSVSADPEHMSVVVAVINSPKDPFYPDETLFDRGARGGSASAEGKGLGLYIVREVALLHSGSVEASTTPDGRTRFAISIPA